MSTVTKRDIAPHILDTSFELINDALINGQFGDSLIFYIYKPGCDSIPFAMVTPLTDKTSNPIVAFSLVDDDNSIQFHSKFNRGGLYTISLSGTVQEMADKVIENVILLMPEDCRTIDSVCTLMEYNERREMHMLVDYTDYPDDYSMEDYAAGFEE